jgi:hypothetical protein
VRFPEETRKAIYASNGKPIEIDWPECAVIPTRHQVYTVQSSRQAGRLQIVVVRVIEDGLRAEVKIEGDPVRSLGKSGGYTDRPGHAMSAHVAADPEDSLQFRPEFEPEALSEAEMVELTRKVKRERIERIKGKLDDLYEELAELQDDPDFSHTRSDVKFMRSLTRKLEARLTREDVRYLADLQEAS